ncbi:MAG: hypothetical protein GY869_20555, partial [Planctomycetes bacterium]|nr:hypothetical protein [Planctomycetota bacterium]
MEFLRRTIKQIQDQLGVLTVSQRFAIFLCLVIMFGAIFWMVNYSSQQKMVPLLSEPLTTDQIDNITAQLRGWQQEFDIKGVQILVPEADRLRLKGSLYFAGALPEDALMSWGALLD